MKNRFALPLLLAASLLAAPAIFAASQLPPNARVAIIGDSITEQKLYSKFMEAYMLACSGVPDVHVFQFGWSGEQAGGFAARMTIKPPAGRRRHVKHPTPPKEHVRE